MKNVISGFVAFLRGSTFTCQTTSLTPWNKFIFTIRALIVLLVVKIGIGFLIILLVKVHLVDSIGNNDSLRDWLAHTSTLDFLLEVVLIGPVLEEFAFRGILQKNPQLVWIGLSSLLYILISNGLRIDYYSISLETLALIFFSILSTWLLRPAISRFLQWTSSVERYKALIWLSAIGFALLHYSNYPFEGVRPQTVVAVLSPHLVAGLLLTWSSQRNGLRWSICLHMLNNTLPVLFVLKERYLI